MKILKCLVLNSPKIDRNEREENMITEITLTNIYKKCAKLKSLKLYWSLTYAPPSREFEVRIDDT